LDKPVDAAGAGMYQGQVVTLSYQKIDEPLDEGRFVLEYILAGNLQTLTV